jgi:hypothetical protein
VRKSVVTVVIALIAALILPTTSSAAPKPGAKCPKKGKIQVYKSYEYKCVKKSGKLVWSKGQFKPFGAGFEVGVPTEPWPNVSPSPAASPSNTESPKPTASNSPTPSPSPTQPKVEYTTANYPWNGPCEKDPWVPAEWVEYEQFALKVFKCSRPFRFWDVVLPTEKPSTELTAVTARNNLQMCKLPWQPISGHLGFNENRWRFVGDITIQIIPIEYTDYKSATNPTSEYGAYLNYIKEMFYKISDGNTRITYRIPDKFFNVGKSIDSYVIPGQVGKNNDRFIWKKLDATRFTQDIVATADPLIDFTNIKMTFIVFPKSLPNTYIAHSPEFRLDRVQTNEGRVDYNYLWPSFSTGTNPDMDWFGAEPFLHLHEVFHANGLLEDHYGDDFGRAGPDVGTGNWGNMSGMLTDFILWDKWVAGMLADSQVICAKPNESSTHWIKPMGYFGKLEKFLIIPLSSTKAIAIESQRRAGMNYKLTSESEGALVYVIDTANRKHGAGITVLRPANRAESIYKTKFIMSDAPLKLNESLIVEGHKITVVEAGAFGDVVRVEKA